MDETNATPSTSSSSAAAVAAASSKAAAATSVKLLIKASSQQFDDQIIESDLLWTVKRLKTQLSLCYPSKPPVADQKLIYSGQLLNDALQLKDVIRSYKDVYTHNHIFHLVYTPKNAPPPNLTQKPKITPVVASNMSSNTDGLRQRNIAAGGNGQQQQQLPHQHHHNQQLPQFAHPQFIPQMLAAQAQYAHCPQYDPNNPTATMPFSLPGQFNMQAMATQQAAMYNWMHQVYAQYMDQCIQFSNAANLSNMSQAPNAEPGATLPSNLFLQQMPFMSANTSAGVATNPVIAFPSSSTTATTAALVDPPQFQAASDTPAEVPQMAAAGAGDAAAAAAAPVIAEQEQHHLDAPRFPNIVQDEQDNRDWLDSFFSITRLAIFLTILYFNSSPLRCLVVVIIAGGIYLYHIGVFRLRHERNNNNINRNNNAAADQIRQGVQQVQQAQAAQQQQEDNNPPNPVADAVAGADPANVAAAAEPLLSASNTSNNASDENAAAGAAEEEDNNSTSVISFVRTFVVTFFTSLLPETPAL